MILRGNNRRRLFSHPRDYMRFLGFLAQALEASQVQMHALTLMANHVHAILRPPDPEALVRAVKSTAQRYAIHRNRSRGGTGKLFEQRYRCIPILTDEQLGIVTCYSDLNAVRAGLVDDPLAFRWSTFGIHVGCADATAIPAEMWTPSCWYLGLAGDAEGRAARYAEVAVAYLEHALPHRHAVIAAAAEALSTTTDFRRVERPDRTRANEKSLPYGQLRGMPKKR